MNSQRDQARGELMGKAVKVGFLAPHHNGGSFRLAEGEQWLDGSREFRDFGERAEHENAFVHFGLHVPQ
jgi:hypothetical protein